MIYNPNDLISKLKAASYKKGYELGDKEEFSFVRQGLIDYGLSTKNFDDNLKTLQIVDNSEGIGYDPKNNSIGGIDRGVELIHELIHMSSNINNGSVEHGAYSKGKFGKSLNEGFVEHLIFSTYNKGYRVRYPIEELVAELLVLKYGDDLLKLFIEGNPVNFYNKFGKDRNEIIELVKILDIYTNKILLSRDIMLKPNYEGNKIQDIGKCYDDAYDALMTFIVRFYYFFMHRDSGRASDFLLDIEDALYYHNKSDIEASKYKNYDNYIRLIEQKIRSLERGIK